MDPIFFNYSDASLKVIQLAHQSAKDLGHSVTGSEHILLGILSDPDSIPGRILNSMGITFKKTEEEVLRLQARSAPKDSLEESFTPRAKALLRMTKEANQKTVSKKVEPEDILIALMSIPRCTGQKIIHALDIDKDLLSTRLIAKPKKRMNSDTTIDQLTELHKKVLSGSFESAEENDDEDDATEDPMLGYIIDGKYEIEEVIGRGGMGIVYRVKHLVLGREFAIKILHPYLASDKKNKRRFQREAQAASRLTHHNLATVFDWDLLEDGRPYLVMYYVKGVKLTEFIGTKDKLSLPTWLSIFMQISEALSHAHNRGVIHRDLKPGNIILSQTEEVSHFIKIVDFGIAKLLHAATDSKDLTQTGEVFGSPMYMSPEQCLGNTIDIRSDIYAMGCVMYEVLTGLPPFYCDSLYDTMKSHVTEKPKQIIPTELFSDIPKELEFLVLKCLAKNTDDRPQSMEALRKGIELIYTHYYKKTYI